MAEDDGRAADEVNREAPASMEAALTELTEVAGESLGDRIDSLLDRTEPWVVRWERGLALGKRVWKALPTGVRIGVPATGLVVRFHESVAAFLLHAFH